MPKLGLGRLSLSERISGTSSHKFGHAHAHVLLVERTDVATERWQLTQVELRRKRGTVL